MALITITESFGSKGAEIARRVSEELHLELYDDERLQEEAIRSGIESKELKSLEEKAPGLFDRIWSRRPQLYLDVLEFVVYEVAKRGHGIIMGHGGQFLLHDFFCALHVRIDASDEFRRRNIVAQYGLTDEVAQKMMIKNDEERRGLLRNVFHMDWDDTSLYDLVINSEKLGEHLSAHLIIETARSNHIEECGLRALSAMDRLSLEKKVEAALLRANFITTYLHIDVPEKGTVHLRGFVDGKEDRDRMLETVREIRGVSQVKAEIWVRPASAI